MGYDRNKLNTFPTAPGVYLMKGSGGAVLYVGKAKSLRTRVRQYFMPNGGDKRPIVPLLAARVEEIETIVVTSEKEALLLESTLIKQHRPVYNALLKDDKSYIGLKINNKHPWPQLELVRYKGKPQADALYFGPYTSALSARSTFDLLNRLFPLRQCSDQEFARRTRPCILYDMKRCLGPCVQRCTKETYKQNVNRTIKFLKGQDKEVVKELYQEMEKASECLNFEEAAHIWHIIRQIEDTLEYQNVDRPFGGDRDALAIYRHGNEVMINQLIFREGKLIGSRHYEFSNIAEEDSELLETFLLQHYEKKTDIPHEILIPQPLDNADAIEDLISQGKSRRAQIRCPQRGDKKGMVAMAFANAEATFKKEKDARAIREKTLLEMQEALHLRHYPCRIECFDNSSIAGTTIVSTMVAFTDGVKDSNRYRKYKIKGISGSDDYGAMREVLHRRYKRAKEENDLPDLVLIDGGKGHLNAALKILTELDIVSIDVIGIAKDEGRHDKGMTTEQIFLPNIKDPILFKKNSLILHLLQQIRDEAHRTALTFHRKSRNKKTLKSALEDIPGIGPAKRKILLTHFGSVKKLLEATSEQLQAVPSLNKTNIEEIKKFIFSKQNENKT